MGQVSEPRGVRRQLEQGARGARALRRRPTGLRFALVAVLSLAGCKKDEAPPTTPPPATPPAAKAAPRVIELKVTEDGFQPANLTVKKDQPLKLLVTRVTDATCATELLIEGTDIDVKLPLNAPAEIAWTPTTAGKVKFGCAMDKMVGGILLVE